MFKHKKTAIVSLFLLSCVLLLCGCTKKIALSVGEYPEDSVSIAAPLSAEDLALLDSFPLLQSLDLSGSTCYEEIQVWAQAHPQVAVRYTIALPDGQALSPDTQVLDLSGMDAGTLEQTLPLLSYFPAVQTIALPQGLSLAQIQAAEAACPQASLDFETTVSGRTISPAVTELDLSRADAATVQELLPWAPYMPGVQTIALGSEDGRLRWEDIGAVNAAWPDAQLDYSFSLYDKAYTLSETFLDLNHIPIEDEGALVKQISVCMNNLQYLDMDSCGVSDEAMAEIRDALPDTKVVWRIWFGDRYSVRTDVERILASNPGMGGELTSENTGSLKYCTKVRYLDLGHNSWLNDVSFVACMPDLEVAVLAMGNWVDISALANCPKLEYAELQTSCLNDLRPLTSLKNLRHLNIAYCMALTDITPLYEMPALERLWIGRLTPIPKEQVAKYKELFPDCEVNTGTLDPTEGGWRYVQKEFGLQAVPRYELLRDQFQYQLGIDAYSYYYNDPLY